MSTMNEIVRRMLGMPHSELPVRLVTPPAHPHTALTPAELAQVQLDLELAEPKTCTFRLWRQTWRGRIEPATPECGKPAVQQRLLACGAVRYQCVEHAVPFRMPYHCSVCGIDSGHEHIIAEMPL